MYLIHKAKKVQKVKNCKIKKVQTKCFRLFAINFTIFKFLNFFSLVYEIHKNNLIYTYN